MPITLSSCTDSNLFIILALIAIFGVIVLGVIMLRKYAKPFQSEDKPVSEEEAARETLDRLLEPVDDEKLAKDISSYKIDTKKSDDEDKGEDKPILK